MRRNAKLRVEMGPLRSTLFLLIFAGCADVPSSAETAHGPEVGQVSLGLGADSEDLQPVAPLRPIGHLSRHAQSIPCDSRCAGEDRLFVALSRGVHHVQSACDSRAEATVSVGDDWKMSIEANDAQRVGRTLRLQSNETAAGPNAELLFEWVKLGYGPDYYYGVSLDRVLTGDSNVAILPAGQTLQIEIDARSILVRSDDNAVTFKTGFGGSGNPSVSFWTWHDPRPPVPEILGCLLGSYVGCGFRIGYLVGKNIDTSHGTGGCCCLPDTQDACCMPC